MAALTSLAIAGAVAGGASMAYGAFESFGGSQKAQQGYQLAQQGAAIQAQAAKDQAQIYKEQAASSVVFAGQERDVNVLAAQQSMDAATTNRGINQTIIANEFAVEEQKRRAMEIDARRNSMEIIRTQQRARSLALATGVNQGGSGATRGSSALGGAYGQIGGQTGTNLMGVQQNLSVGRDIFNATQNISNQKVAQADLEWQYSLQQAQNQTTKANLSYGYAQVNAGYQTRLADTQTMMAQGQGLVSQGQGLASLGQSQQSFGQSFMSAGGNLFSGGMNFSKLLA